MSRFLLINGSPRRNGTSVRFAEALVEEISRMGGESAEILHAVDVCDKRMSMRRTMEVIGQAEVVGFLFPLYVDGIPYPMLSLLERLAGDPDKTLKGKALFAVAQCGFPELWQMQPALETVRLFGQRTGMQWRGGLGYGGGAMLDGRPLDALGKTGERLKQAFALAVRDIHADKDICSEAQDLLLQRIPTFLYGPMAFLLNLRSKGLGRKAGGGDLLHQAYLD